MSEKEKSWIKGIAISVIAFVIFMIIVMFGNMYRTSIIMNERDKQNMTLFEKIDKRMERFEQKVDDIRENYVKKNDYDKDKDKLWNAINKNK